MVLLLSGLPHDHPDESAGSVCGHSGGMVVAFLDRLRPVSRAVDKARSGSWITPPGRPAEQLTLVRRRTTGLNQPPPQTENIVLFKFIRLLIYTTKATFHSIMETAVAIAAPSIP